MPRRDPLSVVPVLLCGGVGSRLWPTSRAKLPKQFAPLLGPTSLLQETCQRVAPLAGSRWLALGNEDHRFLVREQLGEMGVADLRMILEPTGKGTAPAIAAAALEVVDADPEALLLVLPSDHVVQDAEAFRRAVAVGAEAAREGALVAFGVVPTRAETGFGYIRAGEARGGWRSIAAFEEKPDAERAAALVASGDHLWNAGIFLFGARRYLEELERWRPAMVEAVRTAHAGGREDPELGFFRLDPGPWDAIQAESVDHAVMEHTADGAVVALDAGWDDAGSWDSLWRLLAPGPDANVTQGDTVVEDVRGSLIRSETRLVVCLDVEDLVVVETRDAVLVTRRGRADALKAMVERLRREGRPEAEVHRRVPRPWGSFESIDRGDGFQVKRLVVRPGGTLSLQSHVHRAEHWVVVRGVATVVRGEDTFTLHPDQSTYIPQGAVHRLENRGGEDLEVVEVQTGALLEEDDIVRYDDRYGRGPEGSAG